MIGAQFLGVSGWDAGRQLTLACNRAESPACEPPVSHRCNLKLAPLADADRTPARPGR